MTNSVPRSYVICTSPRSGSTLLCHMLRKTCMAGRPGSLFHEPSLASWLAEYELADQSFRSRQEALHAVFACAIRKGTAGTGLFGMRLQQHSSEYFMAQLHALLPDSTSARERFDTAFGPTRFIYLHRSDKIAQAVSRVIAEQSGLWHRNADGSELERLAPPHTPTYDAAAIAKHIAKFRAMDAAWEDWFAAENITPLRISYSNLSDAPQRELARVLEFLGCDQDIAPTIAPPTAQLADNTNQQWSARFRAETTEGTAP